MEARPIENQNARRNEGAKQGRAAFGANLDAIVAIHRKLIAARNSDKLPREEVPLEDVAEAKRLMLSWAGSRVEASAWNAEPSTLTTTLANELNGALKPPPDGSEGLGYLAVSFSRPGGEDNWLRMNTDIGVQCGADRSVYLFEWNGNRWNRRFVLEAGDYRRSEYSPQVFVETQMSAPDESGARLVLATGLPPACMGTWHTLSIWLFRIDKTHRPYYTRKRL